MKVHNVILLKKNQILLDLEIILFEADNNTSGIYSLWFYILQRINSFPYVLLIDNHCLPLLHIIHSCVHVNKEINEL